MHLADHIRPLLRDHDCVIIPDFGGLVADISSARAQPGRQALSPPSKLVAFNQALTRNDGLLVDALSQHLGMPIAQAREAVRAAVASLQRELEETNRTELPGIGIFRRAAGRGLSFEYTGTDNLLAAAFGLPELSARPVRNADARPLRPQPALRGTATRRTRWARLLPGSVIAVAVGLVLLANYQFAASAAYLPVSWRTQLPGMEWVRQRPATARPLAELQQATLGQHDFNSRPLEAEGMTPLENPATTSVPTVASTASEAAANALPEPVVAETAPTAPVTVARATTIAKPVVVVAPEPKTPVAPVVVTAPKLEAAAASKAVSAPAAAATATTIKNRTGRYYVIAGAYRSLWGAEQGRKNLLHSGHKSHIILPPAGSRLFRLTAADYADQASAQREAQRLRVATKSDYNTLKF